MRTAKCVWPIENIYLEFPRAILLARTDLSRILAENHWAQAGEPRGWREAEGTDAHGQDALYLVCELDVELLPRAPVTATGWQHVGVRPARAA